MGSVENETGTKRKEVKDRREQKLSGTIREFLEKHPEEPVSIMTLGGYVYLVPEQTGDLLMDRTVLSSPYSWRECTQIKTGELLQ